MSVRSIARLTVGVEQRIVSITCDSCGESRIPDQGTSTVADIHQITLVGGYGDTCPPDGETLRFDVCGPCLKAWIRTFTRPIKSGSDQEINAIHSETGDLWHVAYMEAVPAQEGVKLPLPVPCLEPVPGVYRHFKGRDYWLSHVAYSYGGPSENPYSFCVYQALYGDSQWFIRPTHMWAESVLVDGKPTPRFRLLESIAP